MPKTKNLKETFLKKVSRWREDQKGHNQNLNFQPCLGIKKYPSSKTQQRQNIRILVGLSYSSLFTVLLFS